MHDGSFGLALQSTAGGLLFDDGGVGHDGSFGLALQSTAGGLLFDDGGWGAITSGFGGGGVMTTGGGLMMFVFVTAIFVATATCLS
jgi:hypothetical protein